MKAAPTGWLAPAFALILSSTAMALPVDEPFDYTADEDLLEQNGGTGWNDEWTVDGETGSVIAPGLTWTDAIGNTLLTSGNAMSTAGTSGTTRNFRELQDTTVTDAWISFLWNIPTSNGAFEGVSFYQDGALALTIANPAFTDSADIYMGLNGSGTSSGIGVFATTHLVLIHLQSGVGANGTDRVELFIDPELGMEPQSPARTIESAGISFNRVRIAAQNGTTLLIDELRIADSFAAATPFTFSPNFDSDGDGVSNADEAILGTNPNNPDTELFSAIRKNASIFGFFSAEIDSPDEVFILGTELETVPIVFDLETSPDLKLWMPLGSAQADILLPAGKSLLRASLK